MNKKRRKLKDNPYIIRYEESNNKYIILFKNNKKEETVNVSKEVYEAFDKFELDDIKIMHEYERHIEHSELLENTLYNRSINKDKSVEEIVEQNIINEKLQLAINSLSEIQKRRIIKYYFDNKTLQEIAKEEKCSISSVKESIDVSLEKLKKVFKN